MANPLARLFLLAATLCAAMPGMAEVLPENVAPKYTAPSQTPFFHTGDAAEELNLQALFQDPDVNTAVRVSVRLGSVTKTFDLALYDQVTPITVTNFLQYVSSGRYASNFFHR